MLVTLAPCRGVLAWLGTARPGLAAGEWLLEVVADRVAVEVQEAVVLGAWLVAVVEEAEVAVEEVEGVVDAAAEVVVGGAVAGVGARCSVCDRG